LRGFILFPKRKASPAQNNFLQRKAIPLLRTANKTEPRTKHKRHKLDFEKRICLKQAAKPAILGGDARAPKRQKPVDGEAGERERSKQKSPQTN